MTTPMSFDVAELEARVKYLYRSVAEDPTRPYHFPIGRRLAEQLGYPPRVLDGIPAAAIESFVGVGYFFDLADLAEGEEVVDLGSGSGTDSFYAALQVGTGGRVEGVDMTDEQLAKAERLRSEGAFPHVTFTNARIEQLPFPDASFDAVISNGVFNLNPDKASVFREASRVLRSGGRLAIADIISDSPLPEEVVGNVDLWATCVGGAAHRAAYRSDIEAAGMRVEVIRTNDYEFGTAQAKDACETYGINSVGVLARKV